MASADLRAELECSVCLNIYTDPVTLKCGHNFCRDCIVRVLDSQGGTGGYTCPECREKFQGRPALHRNITLRNIAENMPSARPDHEQSEVLCAYCIHTPVPAVKSCLMCEAALCDDHLRVHSKAPEHVLCDPTTSPEDRKCSVHKKILEYYCTEDSSCICVTCSLVGEHRGHQVETLEEAAEKKKRELRNVLQKLMTERERTENRVQSLEEHMRKVQGQADDETERVAALFRDLQRRLEDLEKRVLSEVTGQAEQIFSYVSDKIKKMGNKKDELSRKICHIEELCNMMDPLTVLQEPDTGDLCDTKDGHDEDTHDDGGGLDVEGVSNTLHKGLRDIMSEVGVQERPGTDDSSHSSTEDDPTTAEPSRSRFSTCPTIQNTQTGGDLNADRVTHMGLHNFISGEMYRDASPPSRTKDQVPITSEPPRPRSISFPITPYLCPPPQAGGPPNIGVIQQASELWSFADILMDLNTANNWLEIPEDRKKASNSNLPQNRPETPQRFYSCPQVLSSQSFSSGRHYWVVDVKKSDSWIAGMCYASIERKGEQSQIGDNKKSWGVQRSWGSDQLSVIHDKKKIPLHGKVSSNRFGIFLNYEARQISFYDMCDLIQHLHTFTTTFTEPLHAGVCVLRGEIIICGTGCKPQTEKSD